jgi:hypothetical protein
MAEWEKATDYDFADPERFQYEEKAMMYDDSSRYLQMMAGKYNYNPKFARTTLQKNPELAKYGPVEEVEEGEADYGADYQAMVKRVGQLAKQGPLKTVWDPVKRVYKNVPVEPKKDVKEVSDETLIGYLNKVKQDARKHKMDPTKRSPEKANRSVMGFSRAFNKLDARKAQELAPRVGEAEEKDGKVYVVYVDGVEVERFTNGLLAMQKYAILRNSMPHNKIKMITYTNDQLKKQELDENLHKWFKEKWVRFGPDGKIRGSCARGSDNEGKPKCLPQAKAHALGKKGRKYAASKKRREDPNPNRSGPAKNVATKKKTSEAVNPAQQAAIAISMKKAHKKPKSENVKEEKKPDFMKAGNMKPLTSSGKEIPGSVKMLEKLLIKAKDKGIELNYSNIDKIMQHVAKKHNLTGDELHNEFVSKHHMIPDNWIVKQLDEACWKGYHKEGMKTMFGKKYPNCVKNEGIEEEKCPHCGGPMFSEMIMNEKKDACYYKVKSRYKVWPSAYASGALVKCRKKGANNWGTKSESISETTSAILQGLLTNESK